MCYLTHKIKKDKEAKWDEGAANVIQSANWTHYHEHNTNWSYSNHEKQIINAEVFFIKKIKFK